MGTDLDGRHRDEDGRIQRKRRDTLIGTLKQTYPELDRFPDRAELGDVLRSQGADSLSDLLRKIRGQ
jgi:hypothetical protein